MPAAVALLPEGATALEIPSASDRPASIEIFKGPAFPAAANAVRRLAVADVSLPVPDSINIYHNGSGEDPGVYDSRRVAFACITPETAPCRAEPGPFVRRVFRTLALDLPQTLEADGFGDTLVLFGTPADRDAAMRRQPFVLDGVTVRLVPLQTILNVGRTENGYMVHVALHGYPAGLPRMHRNIRHNICRVGFLCEIDPASCFAASTAVRVVLQVEHPRQIPRELRINYINGTTSFVPVEIVSVWDCRHSYDSSGEYLRLFKPPQDEYADRLALNIALSEGWI